MIRIAAPDDLPAVAACARDAFAAYVADIGRPPAPMTADHGASIAAGHVRVCVDAGGTVEGFAVFAPSGGRMALDIVAVRPDCAGRGLGAALMARCEEEARAQGCVAVELYTNLAMVRNLGWYPRLGYRETGRRRADGFDRAYFRKTL